MSEFIITENSTRPDQHKTYDGLAQTFSDIKQSQVNASKKSNYKVLKNVQEALNEYRILVREERDNKMHDLLWYVLDQIEKNFNGLQYDYSQYDGKTIAQIITDKVIGNVKSKFNDFDDYEKLKKHASKEIDKIFESLSNGDSFRLQVRRQLILNQKQSGSSESQNIIKNVQEQFSDEIVRPSLQSDMQKYLDEYNKANLQIFIYNCRRIIETVSGLPSNIDKNSEVKKQKTGIFSKFTKIYSSTNEQQEESSKEKRKRLFSLNGNLAVEKLNLAMSRYVSVRLKKLRKKLKSFKTSLGSSLVNIVKHSITSIKTVVGWMKRGVMKTIKGLGGILLTPFKMLGLGKLAGIMTSQLLDLGKMVWSAIKNTFTAFMMTPTGQFVLGYIAGLIVLKIERVLRVLFKDDNATIIKVVQEATDSVLNFFTRLYDNNSPIGRMVNNIFKIYGDSTNLIKRIFSFKGDHPYIYEFITTIFECAPRILSSIGIFSKGNILTGLVSYGAKLGAVSITEAFSQKTIDEKDQILTSLIYKHANKAVTENFNKTLGVIKRLYSNHVASIDGVSDNFKSAAENVITAIDLEYNDLLRLYSTLETIRSINNEKDSLSKEQAEPIKSYLMDMAMDSNSMTYEKGDGKYIGNIFSNGEVHISDLQNIINMYLYRLTMLAESLNVSDMEVFIGRVAMMANNDQREQFNIRFNALKEHSDDGHTLEKRLVSDVIRKSNEIKLSVETVRELIPGMSLEDAKRIVESVQYNKQGRIVSEVNVALGNLKDEFNPFMTSHVTSGGGIVGGIPFYKKITPKLDGTDGFIPVSAAIGFFKNLKKNHPNMHITAPISRFRVGGKPALSERTQNPEIRGMPIGDVIQTLEQLPDKMDKDGDVGYKYDKNSGKIEYLNRDVLTRLYGDEFADTVLSFIDFNMLKLVEKTEQQSQIFENVQKCHGLLKEAHEQIKNKLISDNKNLDAQISVLTKVYESIGTENK